VAVDVAGDVGAQLAREHREHGLVQQRHPLGHPALPDECPPLEQAAGGEQAGVGLAAAQPPDPPGRGDHGAEVVAVEGALQLQVQEVAVLDALRLVAEQPHGPADPARPDHAVAAQEVVDRHTDGGHGRPAGPALRQVAPVGLLEHGRRLLEVPQPPGGVGECVQVLGGQLAGGPGGGEALPGARPVVSAPGVPGLRQDRVQVLHRPSPLQAPQVTRTSLPSLAPAAKRS
jgi:hypothetical protein